MQMIMFVLDDPNQLDAVLDAWHAVGVSGVTIVESIGSYRRGHARRVRGRYLYGLPGLRECTEQCQYILFAIVPDSRTVDVCLDAAEKIVGDLTEPNTGVLVAWELSLAKGVLEMLSESEARK
jgi:nitrogen regulatory protein PII